MFPSAFASSETWLFPGSFALLESDQQWLLLSCILVAMRPESWREVLLITYCGFRTFPFPSLRIPSYAESHTVYPQPFPAAVFYSLSWPVSFTLELQAVHPSINLQIHFYDSRVSSSASQAVFLIPAPCNPLPATTNLIPSICPHLGHRHHHSSSYSVQKPHRYIFSLSLMLHLVHQ